MAPLHFQRRQQMKSFHFDGTCSQVHQVTPGVKGVCSNKSCLESIFQLIREKALLDCSHHTQFWKFVKPVEGCKIVKL